MSKRHNGSRAESTPALQRAAHAGLKRADTLQDPPCERKRGGEEFFFLLFFCADTPTGRGGETHKTSSGGRSFDEGIRRACLLALLIIAAGTLFSVEHLLDEGSSGLQREGGQKGQSGAADLPNPTPCSKTCAFLPLGRGPVVFCAVVVVLLFFSFIKKKKNQPSYKALIRTCEEKTYACQTAGVHRLTVAVIE